MKKNKNGVIISMKEYRCKKCDNLLFVGNLKKNTKIEVMCKNVIKRDSQENSKNKAKWTKCKTMNVIGMEV